MSGALWGALGRAWAGVRRYRALWALLGALSFGLIAAFGARNYIAERLDSERQRLRPAQALLELVVASRALQAGEVVSAETMALRSIPAEFAPASALTPERFESVIGARLVVDMKAGEPLVTAAMEAVDDRSIATRVKPGIRAMTIAVDEVNSISGMLQPGDRIDLLWSVRPPAESMSTTPEITRMVMQGIAVLATGQRLHTPRSENLSPERSYTTITVEVNPEQAQTLVIAQRSGTLTAVLRNPEDRGPVAVRELDLLNVLGLNRTPETSSPPVPELIVGGRGALAQRPVLAAPPESGPAGSDPPRSAPQRRPADELEAAIERVLATQQP